MLESTTLFGERAGNADCIYVLENKGDGAVVVESGSHDELIAQGGKYMALLKAYSSA